MTAAGSAISLGRAAYDFVMFYLALRFVIVVVVVIIVIIVAVSTTSHINNFHSPRARIPEGDTFLCRMTHGPGMSGKYFVPLTTDEALLGLQATLEVEEMRHYRTLIEQVVNQPVNYRRSA